MMNTGNSWKLPAEQYKKLDVHSNLFKNFMEPGRSFNEVDYFLLNAEQNPSQSVDKHICGIYPKMV